MPGLGVEPACRLHEREVGDLLEVVVGNAAAAVVGGDGVGHAHVGLDDRRDQVPTACGVRLTGGAGEEVRGGWERARRAQVGWGDANP